jgi:hypothetical protein
MTKDRKEKLKARVNLGASDNKESIIIELLFEIMELLETKKK